MDFPRMFLCWWKMALKLDANTPAQLCTRTTMMNECSRIDPDACFCEVNKGYCYHIAEYNYCIILLIIEFTFSRMNTEVLKINGKIYVVHLTVGETMEIYGSQLI